MSHRPHAYALVKAPTHRGNPPNTYAPAITAEVRVYWTPTSTRAEILAALDAAYAEALDKINAQPETYGHKQLTVGVHIDSLGIPLTQSVAEMLAEEAAAAEAAPSPDEDGHAPLSGR